jgi:hypothetical protein
VHHLFGMVSDGEGMPCRSHATGPVCPLDTLAAALQAAMAAVAAAAPAAAAYKVVKSSGFFQTLALPPPIVAALPAAAKDLCVRLVTTPQAHPVPLRLRGVSRTAA